jgi:hypothetical protein
VHSYGVSDTGRVCLAEGSPEMVIYERVPPEGMFMVDLKVSFSPPSNYLFTFMEFIYLINSMLSIVRNGLRTGT